MKWSRLISLSSILCAASGSHVSLAESPRPTDLEIENPHLTASLLNGQIHQPAVYLKAVSILETMESAPSCHRVATLTLINSCQSLEKSASSEVELYEVREEYAARLAMCELTGAKAPISPHCAEFIPRACSTNGLSGFFRRQKQTQDTNGKICYPEVARKQVKQCISALNSRPQWWTSYSNALQNVVVVCQASRNAIEQDEILEQFKKAAVVGNEVTQTVADALDQSKVFISSFQNLQAQVLREWEAEIETSRSALGHLILNVQTTVHSMIESFRQGAENASKHMGQLKQDIEKSHETTTDTSLALQSLYESAKTHFGDMTATQREAWERVGLRADEIGNTLAAANADLPDVVNVLQTILDHFQQSSQNLSALHAELEAKIEKNNDNLILQEHLIKRIGMTGGFDIVQSVIVATAGIVIFKSINSWAAISVLATLIVWLIYRAFTAIPFIHLAPIKTTLPSYVEFALDIQVKVMILVAIVIGICIAVALVVRQRRQAVESCKNPFPQALLPQSVARPDPLHSSRKTPLMVESFLPARQQKPCLARGFRGESAPP